MIATLWHFPGEPAELAPRYDAFIGAVGSERIGFHACLAAPDGLVVVDTCPTREDWERVSASGWLHGELRAAGLPEPRISVHEVHAAIVDGRRVDR